MKVMMRAREMNREWHSWVLDMDFILKFLLVTPKIDYGLELRLKCLVLFRSLLPMARQSKTEERN